MKLNKHIHDHHCGCLNILSSPTIDVNAVPLALICKTILVLLENGATLLDQLVIDEINKLRQLLIHSSDPTTSEIEVALNNIYAELATLNAFRCATNDEIDNIINPPVEELKGEGNE